MIYIRAGAALVGALLVVFSAIRILWQFNLWTVTSITRQVPDLVEGDPRIRYRAEAIAIAVGLALFFLGLFLK